MLQLILGFTFNVPDMTRPLRGSLRIITVAAAALLSAHAVRAASGITGAGSSAAAPVCKVWADEYAKTHSDELRYDPIGSGAGMARINRREVDFGASDIIASGADLKKNGLVMFPTVITGVVPVVNLAKVTSNSLRLSGDVLARIFLGEITQWDAPEIHALNPGLKLPSRPIHFEERRTCIRAGEHRDIPSSRGAQHLVFDGRLLDGTQ